MDNNEMRKITGNINGSTLEGFFYELLRDHLTAGEIEKLVRKAEESQGKELLFTNGHLANYAKLIVKRLTATFEECVNCGGSGKEFSEYNHGRDEIINCSRCDGSGKSKINI